MHVTKPIRYYACYKANSILYNILCMLQSQSDIIHVTKPIPYYTIYYACYKANPILYMLQSQFHIIQYIDQNKVAETHNLRSMVLCETSMNLAFVFS